MLDISSGEKDHIRDFEGKISRYDKSLDLFKSAWEMYGSELAGPPPPPVFSMSEMQLLLNIINRNK